MDVLLPDTVADLPLLQRQLLLIEHWFLRNVFIESTLIQLAVVASGGLIAFLFAGWLTRRFDRWTERVGERWRGRATRTLIPLIMPSLWLVLVLLAMPVADMTLGRYRVLEIAATLLAAWLFIRFTTSFIENDLWSRLLALIVWVTVALDVVGWLDETVGFLAGIKFGVGGLRLSLYDLLRGALMMILLVWAASGLADLFERRIEGARGLTPSVKLLSAKLFKIGLILLAIVVALSSIGIDLTAFAVFSGAVGVGIGFGLQAIFNNFVAGLIILLERSLKVGDFVALESGVTGEVREINIRSTVITTNDNIDILVPNAEFVNGQVTNWTLRDAYRRIHVPFGVAYGSDKEIVRRAGLEAAAAVPYTLKGFAGRDAQVWLTGFGDSCLNFELVVWLDADAVKRPGAVHAAYCWAIDTALSKHGIEIPYPQRDLHVSASAPLKVEATVALAGDPPATVMPAAGTPAAGMTAAGKTVVDAPAKE